MGAQYSIIQYLPDPIAGECINIGILVSGEGRILTRFLNDWTRVERFAGENIDFLKDFRHNLQEAASNAPTLPGLPKPWTLDESEVRKMVDCWHNSIQLTEPRGSTLDPEVLLERMTPRFLKEPVHLSRQLRDKAFAVKVVEKPVEASLIQRLGSKGTKLLKRGQLIEGMNFPFNYMDVCVRDERDYFACSGASFEIKSRREAFDHCRVTAYSVADIKGKYPHLPIGVVILPPVRDDYQASKTFGDALDDYQTAKVGLEKVGAVILNEKNANEWANETVAKTIPPTLDLD